MQARKPPLPADLAALISILRDGHVPASIDWLATIALANQCWLAPALWVAITKAGVSNDIPDDVLSYLAFIHAENTRRNKRLRMQLTEIVTALNGAGITPTLIKGAIHLFTVRDDDLGARMMGDLDLLVEAGEQETARRTLLQLGFQRWHAPAEASDVLYRLTDAAPLELHPVAQADGLYAALNRLAHAPSSVQGHGCSALVPDATTQLLHLILHDQLREGEYWRGAFDLRHLLDAVALIQCSEIAWHDLRSSLRTGLERNAVETQLHLLADLFGVAVPNRSSILSKLQHWRRIAQLNASLHGRAFRILGKAAWLLRCLARGEVSFGSGLRRAARLNGREPEAFQVITGLGGGPKLY